MSEEYNIDKRNFHCSEIQRFTDSGTIADDWNNVFIDVSTPREVIEGFRIVNCNISGVLLLTGNDSGSGICYLGHGAKVKCGLFNSTISGSIHLYSSLVSILILNHIVRNVYCFSWFIYFECSCYV